MAQQQFIVGERHRELVKSGHGRISREDWERARLDALIWRVLTKERVSAWKRPLSWIGFRVNLYGVYGTGRIRCQGWHTTDGSPARTMLIGAVLGGFAVAKLGGLL